MLNKFKYLFLISIAILFITSCEEEETLNYSKKSFVGKWEYYKTRKVTKNKSNGQITSDNTSQVSSRKTYEMKESGISIVNGDASNSCDWELSGNKLNVGCSDFYTINQYSPSEFVLTYTLSDSKNSITNYYYYRRLN